VIKHLDEKKNIIEESNDLSISDNIKTIVKLTKNIPINELSKKIYTGSVKDDNTNTVRQFIMLQQDKLESSTEQFVNKLRNKWNDLVHKQPKFPIWILLSICLSTSAILLCKFVIS
jgi:hypothetical protein